MTVCRPFAQHGFCSMYFSLSPFGASSQLPASIRSRMMCIAACLLVFSLGSLLVKRDSGSLDPTTGSCAIKRLAPITKALSPSAISVRGFFTFVSPSKVFRVSILDAIREGYHPLRAAESISYLSAFLPSTIQENARSRGDIPHQVLYAGNEAARDPLPAFCEAET